MRFKDKVVIVTGAGNGIGEGYAKALGAEGARVAVAEINEEQGQRVAKEIPGALFVRTDVGDPASAEHLVETVVREFGGIDHVVNNAAIFGGMRREGITTVEYDYLDHFLKVNLLGALYVTRAALPHLKAGSAVVNQSSTAAWIAAGQYGIAKAATNSLTVSLASELGDRGIRVNAIAPGPTDTEAARETIPEAVREAMVQGFPLKRMGTPADQAGALLYLLSDDASWVTGQILAVDGGSTVRL
jgi:NAD(P)-dependent dehydrogenase (short-subunit alcohol dehydrogenase family)